MKIINATAISDELAQRAGFYNQGEEVANLTILQTNSARYHKLLAHGRRQLKANFEEKELSLILDCLNGSFLQDQAEIWLNCLHFEIEDAVAYDGLDEKWEVDGARLVQKIETAEKSTIMALIDFTDFFWRSHERWSARETFKILDQMDEISNQAAEPIGCLQNFPVSEEVVIADK